jgi:hypothetical protein
MVVGLKGLGAKRKVTLTLTLTQKELREFSCGIFSGQEKPERGKMKNLHCYHPLPGNGC